MCVMCICVKCVMCVVCISVRCVMCICVHVKCSYSCVRHNDFPVSQKRQYFHVNTLQGKYHLLASTSNLKKIALSTFQQSRHSGMCYHPETYTIGLKPINIYRVSQKNAVSESSCCKLTPQRYQIQDVLNLISLRCQLAG